MHVCDDKPDNADLDVSAQFARPIVEAAPAFTRVSTDSVPINSRFDYWRSLFVASRIERPHASRGLGFSSEMVHSEPWEGTSFADLRGEPLVCHFGERESNLVLLGWINSGRFHIRHGRDQATVLDKHSGLLLADCNRGFVTSSRSYGMTYLALPRHLVVSACGGDPVPRDGAIRVLQSNPLVMSYQNVLQRMSRHAAQWDAAQAGMALRTSRALAIAELARAGGRWRRLPESLDAPLLLAAHHLLAKHADDRKLTAESVAAMLGCSRAHLYRLFKTRERTVVGELRALRMRQARRLLAAAPALTVGAIAWRCGYTEHSAFDKAFRRAFGLTPMDCRQQALTRQDA
jgi:AraC-like DNA-binding protein